MNKFSSILYTENKYGTNITLFLNHLLVVYSFLLPISSHARSSLLSVMLVLFLFRGNIINYLKQSLSNKVVQSFVFLYLLWILGMTYTDNIENAFNGLYKAKYLLLPLFILTFFDKRFYTRIISAFLFGMLFSEFLSYAISFELLPISLNLFSHNIYSTSLNDPSPFFNHINYSVGLALVISILLYALINKKQNIFVKILILLFIMSASVNMSFIHGRTGYISLLVLIVIVTYLSTRQKKYILLSVLFSMLIGIIAYIFAPVVNKRANTTITSIEKIYNNDDYSTSIGTRYGFIKYSLEVIKDNPLLGVGTGDVMDEVRKKFKEKDKHLYNYGTIHNIYLQTWIQFGLIGVFALYLFFYRLLYYNINDKQKKDLLIIVTFTILLAMLPGNFYGHFILPTFTVIVSSIIYDKIRDINYTEIGKKTILFYFLLILLFIMIGTFR